VAVTVAPGRQTRQKRALAAVLEGADQFRSAQQLHAELRERGERVGLTTVYTQLRALADAGLVSVLRTDDGESLYRRCATDDHHHHLVCRGCGATCEVQAPDVEAWASAVARAHGYADATHTIAIVGTCRDCAEAPR
jgi:Fur family ferric uptake transcriptional regulator